MRILIAEVIRSFSLMLAYSKDADPLYKRLKTKQLKSGYPPLTALIDTRITGWKMDGNREALDMFKDLKAHVEQDHPEPALKLYEERIIPFLEKKGLK